jgi:hypothetical protein
MTLYLETLTRLTRIYPASVEEVDSEAGFHLLVVVKLKVMI